MRYCDACDQKQESILKSVVEKHTLHGRSFDVEVIVATCANCGSEVHDEQLLDDAMKMIYKTYNELFGGLNVSEIRAVRGQYLSLGKRPFAKLIGIGPASVGRYEADPGVAMSTKILDIYRELQNNPGKIVDYYNLNSGSLSKRELNKVNEVLAPWIGGNESLVRTDSESLIPDEEIIEKLYKGYSHTALSGYREFDFDKFVNMILYFTRAGVNKTKLMKLLWFSDFYYFKKQTVSISGAVYQRLKFGPVPKDHDILLAHLQHMNIIKIDEHEHDDGWVRMEVRSAQEFDPTVLEHEELATLEKINYAFESFGSRKISDYSHEEKAWIETQNELPIDYNYAMSLREI
ncbi:DUF4065 domain-containing protein [Paenibacillus sp. LHD-117]|uniref:type II toxin-antitoxin system antitoxin SocA domain-containing protein n=1 Tax=Paenibacillus sp. LHD-117 TaxID=3071412 RepID=UPI0027DED61A|nr:type II toxin-antitoxin system antitoxin SocA domain-containing protein [Paenibacillus sp. LHD-117]MDQ6422596.1 DUF4065 domain-containing protein [Paenibacillus sp. LHD-117]